MIKYKCDWCEEEYPEDEIIECNCGAIYCELCNPIESCEVCGCDICDNCSTNHVCEECVLEMDKATRVNDISRCCTCNSENIEEIYQDILYKCNDCGELMQLERSKN